MPDHFENILIWAQPASGKSEVLAFLRCLTREQRTALHIGNLVEIDDYPRVASFFEIDDERQRMGQERLLTQAQTYDDGGFKDPALWDHLDTHLNARYDLTLLRNPKVHETSTVMLECARGGPKGASFPIPHGYQRTLENLNPGILQKAAILYVYVTPEESRRKNDERYDPKDPHGILSHRVPTKVMLNDYGCDDAIWMANEATAQGKKGYVPVPKSDLWIPFGVLDNMADLTSFVRKSNLTDSEREQATTRLSAALEHVLHPLFDRYDSSRTIL